MKTLLLASLLSVGPCFEIPIPVDCPAPPPPIICERVPVCGDGIIDEGLDERCDDGNNFAGDGCRPDCLGFEVCGDGYVDPGEECDLPNPQDPSCVKCKNQ